MATDALGDGFAETMWIDSDVGFEPDDIDKLRSHQQPIVCGIYPQKGRRVLACHVMPGTEKLIFGEEGGLTEILYAGTGFLLVRRAAYEQIQQNLSLACLPIPPLSHVCFCPLKYRVKMICCEWVNLKNVLSGYRLATKT